MKLPNADAAIVPLAKLTGYCLNPHHRDGQHKARVFESALGLDQSYAGYLRQALLDAARTCEATPGKTDRFGTRYTIDFLLQGPRGEATIRSTWIVRQDEECPRLVTCYVP